MEEIIRPCLDTVSFVLKFLDFVPVDTFPEYDIANSEAFSVSHFSH